jgi:fructokinase
MSLFGAIEAGGTKFVVAVGSGPDDIRDRLRVDTTTPDVTLLEVVEFLRSSGPVDAVGIATFGPVELRRDHANYGFITTTPKPGWSDVDLVGPISSALGVPVGLDTDVTGAALGEWRWGAGRGLRNIIYVTVGTGIGGGALIDGRPVPGMVHPEMGHVVVKRQPDDLFEGSCPFHRDCLEGMACGPAIAARWGRAGQDLGDLTERAVDLEARYLASGFRSLVYALAPQRIILGGGVSELPGLFERLRFHLVEDMNGYALQPEHESGFVVPPGLGSNSGLAGAMALAEIALENA